MVKNFQLTVACLRGVMCNDLVTLLVECPGKACAAMHPSFKLWQLSLLLALRAISDLGESLAWNLF